MKISRQVDIEHTPSELLEALARSYEPQFIVPPSVLSDEGRIVRFSMAGGPIGTIEQTIRIAAAGAGHSTVELTIDVHLSLLDRLMNSDRIRTTTLDRADRLIAGLRRADVRPDEAERARDEDAQRQLEQFKTDFDSRMGKDPDFAKRMERARLDSDRELAKHPLTTTLEILSLARSPVYKSTKNDLPPGI